MKKYLDKIGYGLMAAGCLCFIFNNYIGLLFDLDNNPVWGSGISEPAQQSTNGLGILLLVIGSILVVKTYLDKRPKE